VKLCTFSVEGGAPGPGRIEGERVLGLAADSLIAVLATGDEAAVEGEFALEEVRLHAPVPTPPSVRDFFAFEQHVATTRANRGSTVPPEWYELPAFYFSNPAAIFGPDDEIPHPRSSAQLDYELEVAAVIGTEGRIAGFTVMNDWSARDLQLEEVRIGLGPAKGKDFATSLGPILVTSDELDGTEAEMVARVNGEERSRGNLRDLYYSWDAIVERASLNTVLRPGDVIGSGTVGTGCILEHGDGRWLQVGDVVELEVEGIGVLRNTVAPLRS
jgi:2-keto-4-pentenoate hydratase/2-oxohepta-3-ene-1,7-dioic acid hydratase in catechol pathway